MNHLLLDYNATARLLTGTFKKKKKMEHIIQVLAALYWLPVLCRIQHKVLISCTHTLHLRSLMSAPQSLLIVPWSRLKQKGDLAFAVVAPRLYLQTLFISHVSTLTAFTSKLKTFFGQQLPNADPENGHGKQLYCCLIVHKYGMSVR